MSASQPPAGSGSDPSMEDILASIRRILSEDEAPSPGPTSPEPSPAPAKAAEGADDGVLVLDPSMMVSDSASEPEPQDEDAGPVTAMPAEPPSESALVAPEAAAAAAVSVGSLVRTLAAERSMQVRAGGPTIEDIVREELRPLLKAWLDANLPPMVERLVRAEIERVVGRGVS